MTSCAMFARGFGRHGVRLKSCHSNKTDHEHGADSAARVFNCAQAQRIATVTTMTESVIVRLEKGAIVRVIHEERSPSCSLPISSGSNHPRRGRPRRSAVQFERETSCPAAPAVGELRQG